MVGLPQNFNAAMSHFPFANEQSLPFSSHHLPIVSPFLPMISL